MFLVKLLICLFALSFYFISPWFLFVLVFVLVQKHFETLILIKVSFNFKRTVEVNHCCSLELINVAFLSFFLSAC